MTPGFSHNTNRNAMRQHHAPDYTNTPRVTTPRSGLVQQAHGEQRLTRPEAE